MRVLIVGGGGREHALAWAVSRSPDCDALFCAPGNGGTAALGENLQIDPMDLEAVADAALDRRVDLAVIGPEDPLAAGIADQLRAAGIPAFGPSAAAARIESSKSFAKQVMQSANVAHAGGEVFSDPTAAHKWLEMLGPSDLPVLKADGLAAGKGVAVPAHIDEAHDAVDQLFELSGRLLIEDRLAGREVSAMAIAAGGGLLPLPLACDWKRIGDGDAGPNTGGMGVYAQPQFAGAPSEIAEQVHAPVIAELAARDAAFEGLLYAGLMIDGGARRVLEFNARFGDPETQVVLPLLDGDILRLLAEAAAERITADAVSASPDTAVGVVIASGGYPGKYAVGAAISGLDAVDDGVLVFHAGTAPGPDGETVTTGGRVLCVVARAEDRETAREIAYDNVRRISFDGAYHRTDIALRDAAGTGAEAD